MPGRDASCRLLPFSPTERAPAPAMLRTASRLAPRATREPDLFTRPDPPRLRLPEGRALVRRSPGGKTEPRTPLSPPLLVRLRSRATFGSGAAEIASPVARVNETRAPRSRTSSIGQMPFAGLHRDNGFAAVPRFIALFAFPNFLDRVCARPGCPNLALARPSFSGFARPPSPREAFATRASLGPALPADFCNTKQLRARPGSERSSPHTRP